MKKLLPIITFTFLLIVLPNTIVGQQPDNWPDLTIDAATRRQVIDSITKRLNDSYVFPEVAKKMEAAIHERVAKGEYDSVTSAKSLAKKLTEDLQEVSKDKHLRVRYSHEPVPADDGEPREPNAQERQEELRESTWMNHAFNKVERLRGNIGYIEFWGFFNPEFGAETVAAAMNFVSSTDALNWESVGVKPDKDVPAKQALIVARLMALKKSVPNLARPDFKEGVQEEIEKLEKELTALKSTSE